MDVEDKKPGRRATVWAFVVIIVEIGILLFGAWYLWNRVYLRPRLVYTLLPAFDAGGQSLTGLVVENQGRDTAYEVLIKVRSLDVTIDALYIETGEAYQVTYGGQGSARVGIELNRMATKSSVTVYILSQEAADLAAHVEVKSDDGQAVQGIEADRIDTRNGVALGGFGCALYLLFIDVFHNVRKLLTGFFDRRAAARTSLD